MTETANGGPRPRPDDPAPGWFGGYTTKSGQPLKRKPAPKVAPPPPAPCGLRTPSEPAPGVIVLRGGRPALHPDGYVMTREYKDALRADPCAYCGERPAGTLDHIVPSCAGGHGTPDNLTGACRTCNGSKGERSLLEWLAGRRWRMVEIRAKRQQAKRTRQERRRLAREERERKAARMMGWELVANGR